MAQGRRLCRRCERPLTTCYCELITPQTSSWPLRLVQHAAERAHPRGTARIAQLSLAGLSTHEVADDEPFHPAESDALDWADAVLIYPTDHPAEQSRDIEELKGRAPRPIVFVDGTWRKSKAIVLGSPLLRSLPRYSFQATSAPRYRVRKAKRPDFYSTLEAIVAVLNTLEETDTYSQLLEVMDAMVESELAFRAAGNQPTPER